MKDLKDVMVTNSVIDFNNGLQTGAQIERSRIVELIRDTYQDLDCEEYGSMVWTEDIVKLITGEQE
jgi:hypothetical protein